MNSLKQILQHTSGWMLFAFILFSCGAGTEKRADRSAYEEERKIRELKKISEAQLLEKAMEIGSNIASQSQKALGSHLQKAIQEGGIGYAIDFCNVRAIPITDSLESHYQARIKRASLNYRNPVDAPDDLEKTILEAYQYNQQNDLALEDNVQKHGDDVILFTRAIQVENPLCLNCHGTPGREMLTATQELIDAKYPNDQAIGHEMGSLRGMWSIRLSKKEIVKSF
ncbi:MAG: DUF3365 domain-containing protein [Cyclobacteriaceae bacterium]|nr:DUF3365 domain-containing protein [Cyclobacteriaceae bacterium]